MVTPRSTETWPSSGCSSPVIMRNSVVLPAPLGPTRPTFSPRCIAADASMKTICLPFCLPIFSRRIMLFQRENSARLLRERPLDHRGRVNASVVDVAGACGFMGSKRVAPPFPPMSAISSGLSASKARTGSAMGNAEKNARGVGAGGKWLLCAAKCDQMPNHYYFTVRSCISNQRLRRVHIGGRGRRVQRYKIVACAQDDVRVFADLLPEAGDIVTAGIGMDVV